MAQQHRPCQPGTALSQDTASAAHDVPCASLSGLDAEKDPVAAHILLGGTYEREGQQTKAEGAFRSALSLNPKSVEAITGLASVLDNEGQHVAAINYWKQAIVLRPADPELQSSLGSSYLQNGDNEAAAKTLSLLTSEHSSNGAALINLGAALTRLDRYSDAVDVYRKAMAIPQFTQSATLSLVKVLITLARYKDALPYSERYATEHPNDYESHCFLGIVDQQLGRTTDAEQQLRQAVFLNSKDFDSQYHLGAVLQSGGKWEEAVLHLKSALAIRQDSTEAHFQLARAYRSTHQIALANQEEAVLQSLEKAKAVGSQVVVLEDRARSALQANDLQVAIRIYEQILTLIPNDAKARYDLALVYEKLGDRTQERALLEQAAAQSTSIAVIHSQLGFLDMTVGQSERAEAQLKLALSQDPQSVEAMGNLGVLYARSGRLDDAAHLLQLSTENNPGYEKGYLNLGLVLAMQGRYEQSIKALEAAVALVPADTAAMRALDQVRTHRNDKPQAN